MHRSAIQSWIYVPAVAALIVPAAVVFGAMWATGAMGFGTAAIGFVAVAAGTTFLVRRYVADIAAARRFLDGLAQNERDAASALHKINFGQLELEPSAFGLATAIRRAAKSWAQASAALAELSATNAALLDRLPDPLLLLDARRRIVRANRAAHDSFGADLAGRDLLMVTRDPRVLDATTKALGGAGRQVAEFTVPGPVGGPVERIFSARIEPLDKPASDGTAALLSLIDITEARRIEQMRADFVANASHELRTPLSSVAGYLETIRGPAKSDHAAQERFFAIMHEQTARMIRLVDDLLSLSSVELHERTPPADEVDLVAIVKSAVDTLQPEAAARNIRIVLDTTGIGGDFSPVVGDGDELARVFQNLIDNAVKYGKSDTTVEISFRRIPADPENRLPARIAVSVRDPGGGIAPEHIPRLTERFYRVDSARSRALGGTGLGLAIVKHILTRHRGALEVDSVLGQGSTFTAILPFRP